MYMSTRVRVVILRQKGYSVSQLSDRLLEEETPVSLVSIYKLLKSSKWLEMFVMQEEG